jgi:hypothetical protein|tara:strand:+ start:94 stop:234 length:141 start_codon:yes stop_codon:yes gene_type:complete
LAEEEVGAEDHGRDAQTGKRTPNISPVKGKKMPVRKLFAPLLCGRN